MKKLFLLAVLTLYLFLPPKTSALSEFKTTFNSLYTISSTGPTKVTHTITLQNNLAHIYATNYTIATTGDKISNITTSDESGPIENSTTVQNGITTILLIINHPVVGKDQIKTIRLSYETDDVVEVIGATKTINIPRLARANEAESYTRTIKVESVQDQKQLIFPPPNMTEADGNFTVYTFIGHQSDSLALLFGDSVTYKLNLTYELRNKDFNEVDSELALPPDTGYQHIVLADITPVPKDIHIDQDGNWLARYRLKSQEKLIIKAELYATIYPQPNQHDPSKNILSRSPKSKYWDTTSPAITDLAEQLKTPENIYTFITNNFTYNYSGISSGGKRIGALSAISSPANVLCTEFTDSFVSLSRALNIPSREINGYGYTKNATLQPQNLQTDILHAWPEYYNADKKMWISVDPTWGNTTGYIDYFNKLDFSHITFVRRGVEDSYPLPAGAYKSDPMAKYVMVEISGGIKEISQSETRDGIIYNTGNVAIINDTVGYLPPYGSFKLPLSKTHSFYDKIRVICEILLSKFWQLLQVST
jgi:hypothetical protein